MRSDSKLIELLWDLLQEQYANCDPPLDFKRMRKELNDGKNEYIKEVYETEELPKDWFLHHEIDRDKSDELMEAFRKEHKITTSEWRRFSIGVLNWAPKYGE